MKNSIRIILLTVIILATFLMPISGAYAASGILYEYWNTSDDAATETYGSNWTGQTLTTNATVAHTINGVRVKLYRVGSPGTLTVGIFNVDANSHPTGYALTAGSISADAFTTDTSGTWYYIEMDVELGLLPDTMYAIVLSATSGDSSNKVMWRYDSGNGYAYGAYEASSDSGITWTTTGANDFMFEVWGNAGLKVTNVKVFSGFLATGDQLYVCTYTALAEDEYILQDSRYFFNLQVVNNVTVEAQVKLPAWGYMPGSIYINADEALAWGGNYTIRVAGIDGTAFEGVQGDYNLEAGDWLGSDLYYLDDWVISSATDFESYYGWVLLISVAGDTLLDDTGAAIFNTGIPALEQVRPDIYRISRSTIDTSPGETDTSYQTTLSGSVGAQMRASFEDLSLLTGMSAGFLMGVFWMFVVSLVVGGAISITETPLIGAVTLPIIMIVGTLLGLIPLAFVAVAALLTIAYVIFTLIGKGV